MPDDYFAPFASGDRPQPAPLLPSNSSAVLLYLGAGLDLYPVAARFAGFSTFLYVDAKPRLTRAPGHQDHASWRAPADVARSVIDRAGGNLDRDGWDLVAPELLRFRGPDGVLLYYVFATLDFELESRAASIPVVAKLLQHVEALYVHGLYITPETNLHLPALRTIYAIPGNASCADVDFIAEHDCTPPAPSSPFYVPTRAEREHYDKLCAWAGVRAGDTRESATGAVTELHDEGVRGDGYVGMDRAKLERALQVERQLEKFIGLAPAATIQPKPKPPKAPKPSKSAKRKITEPKIAGPPLRFVLIDQISWDDDLPWGTLPPPPVPSATGIYEYPTPRPSAVSSLSSRPSAIGSSRPSGESSTSLPVPRKQPIPHILPPLPFSPAASSPALLEVPPKRFSRPKSGGGAAQGLVRSDPILPKSHPPLLPPSSSSRASSSSLQPRTSAIGRSALEEDIRPVVKTGGYRIAKTVREAEGVWVERERKERERMREEEGMRERLGMGVSSIQTKPKSRGIIKKYLAGGFFDREATERVHAHTV
ncbi:hypothetical protein FRC09_020198 [Ceratobasidium sp. 395]|nr:hypothetical protein FRC09_020198 [Ceratobasidium sp. 395]